MSQPFEIVVPPSYALLPIVVSPTVKQFDDMKALGLGQLMDFIFGQDYCQNASDKNLHNSIKQALGCVVFQKYKNEIRDDDSYSWPYYVGLAYLQRIVLDGRKLFDVQFVKKNGDAQIELLKRDVDPIDFHCVALIFTWNYISKKLKISEAIDPLVTFSTVSAVQKRVRGDMVAGLNFCSDPVEFVWR